MADREKINNLSIELSFNLHPNYWKKGYMSESIYIVIEYLFSIGYANIVISYDDGNVNSENIAKKFGFELSEIMKNAWMKNDVAITTFEMILSNEKWLDRKNKKGII